MYARSISFEMYARSVSLASTPCKILEPIMKDSINKYLDKYNIISSSQHGFSSGKYCSFNLSDFL